MVKCLFGLHDWVYINEKTHQEIEEEIAGKKFPYIDTRAKKYNQRVCVCCGKVVDEIKKARQQIALSEAKYKKAQEIFNAQNKP